jgi:hypothetical protein
VALPFQLSAEDISALSDVQLTQLLHRLLLLEAEKLGLPKRRASVSLNIDAPDGGEDGRIEWDGEPAESDWLPSSATLFQVKATEMGPAKCGEEVRSENGGLKPRVREIVDRRGSYVLFYGRPCEGQAVAARVEKISEAFADVVGQDAAKEVDILVYGAEKISAWANEFASTIAFVQDCLGRSIPSSIQTWQSWNAVSQSAFVYHPDAARVAIAEDAKQTLQSYGAVVRIAALSGLGKSRLALELFRPPESAVTDPEQAVLSATCVYVADGSAFAEDLTKTLIAFRARGTRAIVVVDECPLELHEKLEPIVSAPGSRLSLMTLDFDPRSDPRSPVCKFRRLEPMKDEDILALLKQGSVAAPSSFLSRIVEFAQGFPRMAELLVRAMQSNANLWELSSTAAIKKLVVQRMSEPERVLGVARALSVLEHLGVDGLVKHEFEIFCRLLCNESEEHAYAILRNLESAGIANRRGDYVRVTPLPIAVALAGEWWNECNPDRARRLLLTDDLTPAMADAVANQLRRLAGHEWVQKLISEIYGPESPFRQRDLLDSARGSRLASCLAEANPKAVSMALTSAFGSLTPREAKEVVSGRRDLVWCLEKLAWWTDTFDQAAWILLIFAAGENEKWGNNATNQFLQLYHVYLSGTERPATQRLSVIRRALEASDVDIDPLVVSALAGAFQTQYTRFGGADSQGGRLPRVDWEPKSREEILQYWNAVADLLQPFLLKDDGLGAQSRRQVAANVRGMLLWGGISIVERFASLASSIESQWTELLDALRSARNYDRDEHSTDTADVVDRLITALTPRDLATRLKTIVSVPSWDELRKEEDGSVTQVAEERAIALGAELSFNANALMPHWASLLAGEQRQGFNFGRSLGEASANIEDLLATCIEVLSGIPPEKRNPSVAMGICHALASRDPSSARKFVRQVFDNPVLLATAVDLNRTIGLTDDDAHSIAKLLSQGLLASRAVSSLAYGGSLTGLSDDAVADLLRACAAADSDGPVFALDLLGMRRHSKAFDHPLLTFAREFLLSPGVLSQVTQSRGAMGEHHFEVLVEDYLTQTNDADFAKRLMASLVEALKDKQMSFSRSTEKILKLLLKSHASSTWPILRSALEARDNLAAYRVLLSIDRIDLVALVGESEIFAWADRSKRIRDWVPRVSRLLETEEGGNERYPSWTRFALQLLERYGAEPDVLSAMSAAIYSGSWTGSAVPRLLRHKKAYDELTTYPNRSVAEWAGRMSTSLEAEISEERKRDEERDFGIYR